MENEIVKHRKMRVTKMYTAEDVEKLTAGGRSYIRTKENIVVGLAITKKMNPQAPKVVIVGDGPIIIKNARLFLNQGCYIPTYVKLGSNQWIYKGEYKVKKYSDSNDIIEKYRKHRTANRVTGILFLEKKMC